MARFRGLQQNVFDYTIYTDGAYSRQNDEGAYAYVMLDKEGKEIKTGAWKIHYETNQRAELKAIIKAISHLPEDAMTVRVISDSLYALNTLAGFWRRRANTDLFDKFEEVLADKKDGFRVFYEWVKGHSGNHYNEMCDRLCTEILGYDCIYEYKDK